jgi:hypothetical protein
MRKRLAKPDALDRPVFNLQTWHAIELAAVTHRLSVLPIYQCRHHGPGPVSGCEPGPIHPDAHPFEGLAACTTGPGFRVQHTRPQWQDRTCTDDVLLCRPVIGGTRLVTFALRKHYILNTPNRVRSIGAFRHALNANDNTVRVSLGMMIPSSQRRAVAK